MPPGQATDLEATVAPWLSMGSPFVPTGFTVPLSITRVTLPQLEDMSREAFSDPKAFSLTRRMMIDDSSHL